MTISSGIREIQLLQKQRIVVLTLANHSQQTVSCSQIYQKTAGEDEPAINIISITPHNNNQWQVTFDNGKTTLWAPL